MKLRKFKADHKKDRFTSVSDSLLFRDDLSMIQRLFLIEIIRTQQLGGDMPFVSQSLFAKRNRTTRTTIGKELNDLIERGILTKYKQTDSSSACEFLINWDYLSDNGYSFIERTTEQADTVEKATDIQPPDKAPPLSEDERRQLELEEMSKRGETPF